jgi:VIT1/CCC1 family predicted Fe2+/Mn2+ transporter
VGTVHAVPPVEPHQHRDVTGGAARAAVFGVSDGLTTNVALILGVAGAHPAGGVVRLAGLAGLIGGAFSMAAGEWVSMRAQSELVERELAIERRALAHAPESERRELSAIYRQRGIDRDTADSMADQVMADPEVALEVHAREELGVNPNDLGSPVRAAASSFVTFAIGALVPLIPWLVAHGGGATLVSVGLAAIASVGVGILLARFTGRSVLLTAARQVGIVAAASVVTYAIGAAVGVSGG